MKRLSNDAVFADLDFPKPYKSDVLAGISVALVLIPQCLAYAVIAGLPPFVGLYASAIPLLVFALFASSPYLQTGPVATTSLLTLAALSSAGFVPESDAYVQAGITLALMVGVIRIALGLCRLGWVAYLVSDPVMIGFTSGAAILIMASQFPKCVGVELPDKVGVIADAISTLQQPGLWHLPAIALALTTVVLMVWGKLLHRHFPGVLIAVVIGVLATTGLGYAGPVVGKIPGGLPELSLSFAWASMPSLLFVAFVIAFIGFAEPSAIARFFANEDGSKWNANREFFASGLANIAAGISGAYPVGGSFSRSSVNRVSGAKTRWSGGVTGVCVLVFLGLGFATILSRLPLAILGGIVLAAVHRLTKPRRMLRLWLRSPIQAALAWATFAATIIFTPKVHWAIMLGVGLSLLLHFTKGLKLRETAMSDEQITLRPEGLLWFATQGALREQLSKSARLHPQRDLMIDLSDLIALDATTLETIADLAMEISPRKVRVSDSPWETQKVVEVAIRQAEYDALAKRLSERIAHSSKTFWLAVVGAPGSGKSTLSEALCDRFGDEAVVVPMDGYHHYRSELDAMPNSEEAHRRRGAPFTFNAERFVTELKAAHESGKSSFPSFDHQVADPVENSVNFDASQHKLVILEGNYLLLPEEPWDQLQQLFDESWFVDAKPAVIKHRLEARFVGIGLSPEEAKQRVEQNDMLNADLIVRKCRELADRVV